MSFWRSIKRHRRARARGGPDELGAYVWVQTSGRAALQRRHVFRFLQREGPHTRNEISAALKVPISSVCARVDELLAEHLVVRGQPRPSRVTGIANETIVALTKVPVRVHVHVEDRDHVARQTVLESWSAR